MIDPPARSGRPDPGGAPSAAGAPSVVRLTRRTFIATASAAAATLAAGNAAATVAHAGAPDRAGRGGPIELTMWHDSPETRRGFQHVFDAFQQDYPDITIKQAPKSAEDYGKAMARAIVADELPDLFVGGDIATMARGGQLLDLTAHVPNIRDALPIARAINFVDGRLYSVTWGRYTVVMMYNRELMARLGLAPPREWVEWRAQCKRIKRAGLNPIAMSGDGLIDAFWFTELATAALGPVGFGELLAGRKKMTSPEMVEALQFMLDLVPYYQPGFLATTYTEAKALFATGKAVMLEAGSADVPGFKALNPNLAIGVFAFPTPRRGGAHVTLSGLSETVAASARVPHPEAACTFLNWCLSARGAATCSAAINLLPVVRGVVPAGDPVLREIIGLSQHDFPVWYERPRLAPAFAVWGGAGKDVFTGRLSAARLLALIQRESDAAAKGS